MRIKEVEDKEQQTFGENQFGGVGPITSDSDSESITGDTKD